MADFDRDRLHSEDGTLHSRTRPHGLHIPNYTHMYVQGENVSNAPKYIKPEDIRCGVRPIRMTPSMKFTVAAWQEKEREEGDRRPTQKLIRTQRWANVQYPPDNAKRKGSRGRQFCIGFFLVVNKFGWHKPK